MIDIWRTDDPWGVSLAVNTGFLAYTKPVSSMKKIDSYTTEYSIILKEHEVNCMIDSISLIKEDKIICTKNITPIYKNENQTLELIYKVTF